SNESLRGFDHAVHGDAKMRIDCRRRRRRTEALDSQNYPVIANPAVPGHRMRCLHRDSLYTPRQHAFLISLVLPCEELVAWHAHGAGANTISLEFLLGVMNKRDLRAARDQHYFRSATQCVGEHVSAARQSTGWRILRPVDE